MDRYIGYYRAMLKAGLDIKNEWLIEDWDEEREKIELQLPEDMPTAFVCNSDVTAFELEGQVARSGGRLGGRI